MAGSFTRSLDLFRKHFHRISLVSGQVLIFGMTMLITVDVLGRQFIGKSTLIATEVSGYALVAIVFLGLAYTLHTERHIKIDLVTRTLPPRVRQILNLFVLILSISFIIWLTYATSIPVKVNFVQQHTSITSLHTPMWIPYLFVPIGTGMLAIGLIIELIYKIRNLKTGAIVVEEEAPIEIRY
jgi:TRAP-type C4-dicarboxylate transport system permease small subunit